MRLRYVLLIAAFSGALSAFFLAADLYNRLQPSAAPASTNQVKPELRSPAELLVPPTTINSAGAAHVIGLVSLGFIFLTIFLFLLSALRDPEFVRRIEHDTSTPVVVQSPPVLPVTAAVMPDAPQVAPASEPAVVMPWSDLPGPDVSAGALPEPVEVHPDSAPEPVEPQAVPDVKSKAGDAPADGTSAPL